MKLYLLACYAFFTAALWILFSCQMATEPTLEEKNMALIRLYSEWSFNIGPGGQFPLVVGPNDWLSKNLRFGALSPDFVGSGSGDGDIVPGISLLSNVLIRGYQIKFKSPPNIRPGSPPGFVSFFPVTFSGRKTESGNLYVTIPFLDDEYHETNILLVVNQPPLPGPSKYMPGFYAVPGISIDTRNLQDVYKNSIVTLQIIIDVESVWVVD